MKKTLLVISSFVLCVMLFFGCSFIEPNKSLYYNTKVLETTVKINGVDKNLYITVGELIDGLNNFGYSQYFSTSGNDTGYSDEEAIKKTAMDLLDDKILIEYTKTIPTYQLEEYDFKKAKYYTYQYINNSISSFEAEIREEWELNDPESDLSSSEEEGIEYEEYEKSVERVSNVYALTTITVNGNVYNSGDRITEPASAYSFNESTMERRTEFAFIETPEEEKLPEITALSNNISDWLTELKYISHGAVENPEETDKKVFEEAKRRLLRALKINYAERGITGKTDAELLDLEIKKVFEKQQESLIIYKMQKAISDSISKGELAMNVINQKIAAKFIDLYSRERAKYASYINDIVTEAEKQAVREYLKENPTAAPTYYSPVSGEYFLVQHILLKYTDAQTNQISNIKTKAGMTSDEKDKEIEGVADNISVNGKSWKQIYAEVKTAVDEANGITEKANVFRDFMFKYTGDTATLNAGGDYIIPLNSSLDSMEKPFADKSRELQAAGNIGGIDIELTTYGYHIIMYVGMYENKFEGIKNITPSLGDAAVFTVCNTLYNTPIKAGHNKNYYDEVLEKLEMASFEDLANGIVRGVRNGITLNWHRNVYKDILKITLRR